MFDAVAIAVDETATRALRNLPGGSVAPAVVANPATDAAIVRGSDVRFKLPKYEARLRAG
jgi:hypothetical protein